jgi:hypothetical protein
MAIELSTMGLSTATIYEDFSATITASPTVDPIFGSSGEVINFVTAELLESPQEPNIIITPGTTSVTISGKHLGTFNDKFTYVSKGSTNNTETPTEVVGIVNMPPNKELYNLDQDGRLTAVRNFLITVTYDNTKTATFTVSQTINNSLEGMRRFMAGYYR